MAEKEQQVRNVQAALERRNKNERDQQPAMARVPPMPNSQYSRPARAFSRSNSPARGRLPFNISSGRTGYQVRGSTGCLSPSRPAGGVGTGGAEDLPFGADDGYLDGMGSSVNFKIYTDDEGDQENNFKKDRFDPNINFGKKLCSNHGDGMSSTGLAVSPVSTAGSSNSRARGDSFMPSTPGTWEDDNWDDLSRTEEQFQPEDFVDILAEYNARQNKEDFGKTSETNNNYAISLTRDEAKKVSRILESDIVEEIERRAEDIGVLEDWNDVGENSYSSEEVAIMRRLSQEDGDWKKTVKEAKQELVNFYKFSKPHVVKGASTLVNSLMRVKKSEPMQKFAKQSGEIATILGRHSQAYFKLQICAHCTCLMSLIADIRNHVRGQETMPQQILFMHNEDSLPFQVGIDYSQKDQQQLVRRDPRDIDIKYTDLSPHVESATSSVVDSRTGSPDVAAGEYRAVTSSGLPQQYKPQYNSMTRAESVSSQGSASLTAGPLSPPVGDASSTSPQHHESPQPSRINAPPSFGSQADFRSHSQDFGGFDFLDQHPDNGSDFGSSLNF